MVKQKMCVPQAIGTILTLGTILAWAPCLSFERHGPRMVKCSVPFALLWMHLDVLFVLSIQVAISANIKIFVQQFFASITVHVEVGKLSEANLTEKITFSKRI